MLFVGHTHPSLPPRTNLVYVNRSLNSEAEMPINSQHIKGGEGGGGEGEGGGGARGGGGVGGGGGGRKGKKEGEGAKGSRKPKVDKPTENRVEDPERSEGIVITTFRWVYTNSILYAVFEHEKAVNYHQIQ
jgi:hypothetical protein